MKPFDTEGLSMLGNKTRIVLTKTKDKFFHLQIFVSSVASTLRFPKLSASDLSVRPASIVCQRTPIPINRIYPRLFCNKDNFCTVKCRWWQKICLTKQLFCWKGKGAYSSEQKLHLHYMLPKVNWPNKDAYSCMFMLTVISISA